MEKLFLSLALMYAILSSHIINAQHYAVFKVKGRATNIINSKAILLQKGQVITKGTIHLKPQDTVLLLNNNGKMFELINPVTYKLAEIINFEKEQNDESFTKKYFSYVWRQMNNDNETESHTGNVYRAGLLDVINSPRDSLSIYSNEINFSWSQNKKEEYSYFFLKNLDNNNMSKIKLKGNTLTLYPDNNLLVKGATYSWGIAYSKFPNFNRVKFNTFKYLNEQQYNTYKSNLQIVSAELKSQNFSIEEINAVLCNYFNLCTEKEMTE